MGGVLKDPALWPQSLLLAHGGKLSDRQSTAFRADFDCALQALQTYGLEPAGDGECDDMCYEGVIKHPRNVLTDPESVKASSGILSLLVSPEDLLNV